MAYHFSKQRMLKPLTLQLLPLNPNCTLSGIQEEKQKTGYWPLIAMVHIQGVTSIIQSLASSHTQKRAEFIILRCLSGLISTNLLMFDSLMLVCCFCKNSYKSWLLLYLFRTVPQSYLRGCIPSLSPQ